MKPKTNVSKLSRLDRGALEKHFLVLGAEDRRLRFGISLGDMAVRAYVSRIDFEHDSRVPGGFILFSPRGDPDW